MADAVAARPGRWHEDISAFADDNGLKKVLVLSSGSFVPSFRRALLTFLLSEVHVDVELGVSQTILPLRGISRWDSCPALRDSCKFLGGKPQLSHGRDSCVWPAQ